MGPKTKAALEAIVDALNEFPKDHHRQLLEWAEALTSGTFSIHDIASGRVTWDRTNTWHESAYPDYAPTWE